MDAGRLAAAKAFIAQLQADPQLLHNSDYQFFKDYLLSLGATLPPHKSSTIRLVPSLADWNALVAEVGDKPIVVDFFAEWCGPCKAVAPIFKQLADKYSAKVVFAKVDVDVARDVARKYNISSMPTFRLFRGLNEIDQVVGANPAKLTAMVENAASGKAFDKAPGDAPVEDDPVEEVKLEEDDEEDDDEENQDELLEEMEKDPDILPEEERDINPPPVPVGPMSAQLSDAEMDKQIELKGKASELASSGDLEGALAAWNEVIAMSASPLTLAKRADVFLKLKKPYAAIRDCDAALAVNPDSAKSLKIRGMAYHLLGDWENAATSLQKGNRLDYDEKAGEVQRVVEARWNKIREYRLQKEARARDRNLKKNAQAKAKARAEAIRRYEAEKTHEAGEIPKEGTQEDRTPGSGGADGTPGSGAGGASPEGLEQMLNGLNLPPDVKEKMKDPNTKKKLTEVFTALQSNPAGAMGTAMKYMSDPDIGPILSAVMQAMMPSMGEGGGPMPGGMGGGMPRGPGGMPGGMGGGMPGGMGGGMPGGMGDGMPGAGFGSSAADEVD